MRVWIAALLFCCFGLAFASGQPPQAAGQQSRPANQNTTAQAQTTESDKRGTRESPIFIQAEPSDHGKRDAAKAQEEGREKSRDEWSVTVGIWTIIIGIATILILVVQACVFVWQGCQLKRTVQEMKRATAATKIAADAAKRSADIAETTLITTSRPWLHVETRITEFIISDTGIQVEAKFTCLNAGKSPATYAARHIRIYRMPIPANEVRATILRDFADIPEETHFGEAAFPGFEFRESAYINDPNIARNDGKAPYYLLCGISYIFDFGERIRHFSIEGILVERVSETVGNNRTNGFKFTSLGVYSD